MAGSFVNPAVSYGYSADAKVRDVNEAFNQLLASMPVLMNMMGDGLPATNTKVEWTEDQIAPARQAVTVVATDDLTVADASAFPVGTVIAIESSAGVSKTELVQVTAVSTNTLTVSRTYGGSTGSTIVVGDILIRVSKPIGENTQAPTGEGRQPEYLFNYTQIFDAVAEVSRTSNQVDMYGFTPLDYAEMTKMREIAYDINNALIYGRRVERSASANGTLGGILQYINTTGGNIDTTGGNLSPTIINNIIENIYNDGGYGMELMILCNTNQARRISAFDNSSLEIMRQDTTTGKVISRFQTDLPMAATQMMIMSDNNFPKDQLVILTPSALKKRMMQPMIAIDATQPGQDGRATRLLTELSLEVMQGKNMHGIATGLNV